MATIIDVARRASVSTATVSRVLSQPGIVSPATRERVERAVAELGYKPNKAAQTLRTLRAGKLLVTVPLISNPFFGDVIDGAEAAARAGGYAIVLANTRLDPGLDDQYAEMLLHREVDGLIFLGPHLPQVLRPLVAAGERLPPLVNGGEYVPGLGVSSVHIDNAVAAAEGLEHLIRLGHRRVGVVTGHMTSANARARLAGVEECAGRHRLGDGLRVRHGNFTLESGLTEARGLLDEGVTAIFCLSDEMAIGALQAVHLAGLSCPGDVSVMGFDDIRFAQYLTPSLTTVAQPSIDMGRKAVELLLRIIDGELTKPQILTLQHRLMIRDSTAAPPAGGTKP